MKYKKAQFQLEWVFAIIVGAMILFLAIYAVSKTISTYKEQTSAEVSKELSILTDPLERGYFSGSADVISMKAETRIYNKCFSDGFGKNELKAISKTGFGDWKEPEISVPVYKYIFSSNIEEGKNFYVFSKSFDMPFRITNLIYLTSGSFCFISPPEEIREEIENLKIKNIQVSEFLSNCSSESKKVCFEGNCEININPYMNYVEKSGQQLQYLGNSLMYAAIFSDPGIYTCNLKRLINKINSVSKIYLEKANMLNQRGISISDSQLMLFIELTNNSTDLSLINLQAEEANRENIENGYKLWS
ncbi:hypothetical protein COV16_00580 [Candidatus Woesearchaeota archaeon CG10_big_fil_rev_8_21_14_0_10_34_8]|nr:MAG: hypothetical protein COV16_00580 [Candidatus Woesearchaeota archaeon CG10_big_fil_rev_8_21_14_0_10_34_8]